MERTDVLVWNNCPTEHKAFKILLKVLRILKGSETLASKLSRKHEMHSSPDVLESRLLGMFGRLNASSFIGLEYFVLSNTQIALKGDR